MRYIICIIYLMFNYCVFSQTDYKFIKHLSHHQLHQEHAYYLKLLQKQGANTDSVNVLLAKYYLLTKNDTLFFNYFFASSQLYQSDTNAYRFANYYFLNHRDNLTQKKWFNYSHLPTDTINKQIISMYQTIDKNEDLTISLNDNFNKDVLKYNRIKNKKPALAAGLSALVPGLGKLYGKRPNSALITFFSESVLAYQCYETINLYGIKNAFSIFSISYFGFMYLSNIYGSYHDLKDLKKQQKKQLLIDAEKYYHINYPALLY